MSKPQNCKATKQNDEYFCHHHGLRWGVNNHDYTPDCSEECNAHAVMLDVQDLPAPAVVEEYSFARAVRKTTDEMVDALAVNLYTRKSARANVCLKYSDPLHDDPLAWVEITERERGEYREIARDAISFLILKNM